MEKQSASSRSAARGRATTDASTSAEGRRRSAIPAEKRDELFDSASDEVDKHLAWDTARRPGREVQRVNVDFPIDLLRAIDLEARRIGVSRQAFIKLRLTDALTPWSREWKPRQHHDCGSRIVNVVRPGARHPDGPACRSTIALVVDRPEPLPVLSRA